MTSELQMHTTNASLHTSLPPKNHEHPEKFLELQHWERNQSYPNNEEQRRHEKLHDPESRNARRMEAKAKNQLDRDGISTKIAPFFIAQAEIPRKTERAQIPAAGLEFITREGWTEKEMEMG